MENENNGKRLILLIDEILQNAEDTINNQLNEDEVSVSVINYTYQLAPFKDEVELLIEFEEGQLEYEITLFSRSNILVDESMMKYLINEIQVLNNSLRGKFDEEHLDEHLEEIKEYIINEMKYMYSRFTVTSNMSLKEIKY